MKLILALFLSSALLSGCKRGASSAHSPPVTAPPGVQAHVIGITDGDTLTVLMDGKSVKIGLEGIDAPEHGQPQSFRTRHHHLTPSSRIPSTVFGWNQTTRRAPRPRFMVPRPFR